MKVLIADDHPLFREAMKHVLNAAVEGAECTEVATFDELLAATPGDDRFDLILLDLQMPGGRWPEELFALRRRAPATPTVVVSSLEDPATVRRVVDSGAAGYIPKSASKTAMEEAVRQVLGGESSFLPIGDRPAEDERMESLTTRQLSVLGELALGKSNKQIADALCVEEITVKTHVTAIFRKLGVRNRLQAAMAWRQFVTDRGAR
ncbi:MAG: response regulator transcription factor [Candidatus Eremiobacteraeota bacterium]|nr:response regulator transcription factor [Candidatus Eremiobacteraeota bacterium]